MFDGVKKAVLKRMKGGKDEPPPVDDAAASTAEALAADGAPPVPAGADFSEDAAASEEAALTQGSGEKGEVNRSETEGTEVTEGNTRSEAKQNADEAQEGGASESAGETNGSSVGAQASPEAGAGDAAPEDLADADLRDQDPPSVNEQQLLIESLKAEVAENYDKYLRAVAEMENYKKRALRERSDLLRYAGENLARDVLEVADNLERALAADSSAQEDFAKGIKLTYDRLITILEQHGVKGEKAIGGAFDPVKHEALATVPTEDQPAGTVLDEFKRAYFFKDKLLRPAQVVVAAAVESAPAEKGDDGSEEDGAAPGNGE